VRSAGVFSVTIYLGHRQILDGWYEYLPLQSAEVASLFRAATKDLWETALARVWQCRSSLWQRARGSFRSSSSTPE
jgi:hypothetical protein